MANTLASELARVQSMVRELEANMDLQEDLPPAAREICGALASSVDRSLRIARSWMPESPDGGSPRGEDNCNAAKDAQFKRRKGVPSVRTQVRVTAVQDTSSALGDGFSWRKYGQKDILGAKYPRAYFRCTHRNTQSCLATKQVQRADADPLLFDVVYHGAHTCVQAARATTSTEQQHLQPVGHQEHITAVESRLQAGFEPLTPPFPFASSPAGTDGLEEWQQFRNGHSGLELEHQLEEFFSNPSHYFQWDFQGLL